MLKTLRNFRHNPIMFNELRLRMRGRRTFILLAAYLIILSALVLIIYALIYQDTQTHTYYGYGAQRTLEASANLGKAVFYSLVLLLLFILSLISPALSAGVLVGEKERQTYDILIMTVSARRIVLGKLSAVLIFMGLLILAALPFQTMAYFFGGITMSEVLIATLMLYLSTLHFCSLGLFVSSFARSTTQANMINYAAIIPLLLLVPLFIFGLFSVNDPLLFDEPSPLLAGILIYTGLFFLSINPLSMAVTSEIFFLQTDSYIFSMESIISPYTFPLLAPWIIHTIFSLGLSFLFVYLAIRRVDRVRQL